MRVASTHATVQRIWTVELRPQPGGPALACPHCTLHGHPVQAASARSAALTHLARHARTDALPGHLRTCQCRARGCQWHPRHRGCAGPVLLALTRDRSGRTWRLADACAACAAATSHTAVVPATLLAPRPPGRARCRPEPPGGPAERTRVREMLTYLAAALPQFTSPGARLLALQCALRSDTHGCVQLPGGLLRGMRLHGRSELWEELEHTRWLRRPAGKYPRSQAQLLDAAVLSQQPGSRARARAAHWALRPTPLAPPTGRPAALQLTALALASHTSGGAGNTDMNVLARLCGHSSHQAAELLDRLTAARTLAIWHHDRETDEVFWHLPQQLAAALAGEPGRH
ncbi:hypothetical protein [Streptomyces europaeiscabiei]|uniref:hypothetical protein n=1 Tax=Streptomyces europaeiscabiei TaxID=146819 RepID=UPI0029B99A79|nr:hypothetical protein [Streptomyces europaeiscabiei]MDX3716038.1 hypothetical protein [Streptomyces europaeiscabiei]MDX3867016.1 hypothetical protein [Streptomyces europaeiscabiei]MDX3875520.1 hypothetical protein [Streptomyces europaeiscabiei]